MFPFPILLAGLLLCHGARTMPFMHTSVPTIELYPTTIHLIRTFDALVSQDVSRAHKVLNTAIASIHDIMWHRPLSSPQRYRSVVLQHIKDCHDLQTFAEQGFRGFYILQVLVPEHLQLLMSIESEIKFITAMMSSLYQYETGIRDDTDVTLLRYAHEAKYSSWKDFLSYVDEDERDEDE